MFVETMIPVIPSEVIMMSAGVAVAHGTMSFWPLVIASAIGATIGNMVWFTLGHRLGYERLRPIVERHGRWLTLDWPTVERGTRFLRHYRALDRRRDPGVAGHAHDDLGARRSGCICHAGYSSALH